MIHAIKDKIKLTIVCLTYNHVKYIDRAIRGFLSQNVDFLFEIIIHDDASTDGTTEIIRKYEKQFPNIIKPIYQTENQWKKGVPISKKYIYPKIRGEYVAFCEGDDYWIEKNKIYEQVHFLDNHKDFYVSFSSVLEHWENSSKMDSIFPSLESRFNKTIFTQRDLLIHNFIPTCSVVYRWVFHDHNYDLIPDRILPTDWYLHLLHANFGKIHFLNKVTAVYNRHTTGIWFGAERSELWYKKYAYLYINFLVKVQNNFNANYYYRIKFHIMNASIYLDQLQDKSKLTFIKSLDTQPDKNIVYVYILYFIIKLVCIFTFGYYHDKYRQFRSDIKKYLICRKKIYANRLY